MTTSRSTTSRMESPPDRQFGQPRGFPSPGRRTVPQEAHEWIAAIPEPEGDPSAL